MNEIWLKLPTLHPTAVKFQIEIITSISAGDTRMSGLAEEFVPAVSIWSISDASQQLIDAEIEYLLLWLPTVSKLLCDDPSSIRKDNFAVELKDGVVLSDLLNIYEGSESVITQEENRHGKFRSVLIRLAQHGYGASSDDLVKSRYVYSGVSLFYQELMYLYCSELVMRSLLWKIHWMFISRRIQELQSSSLTSKISWLSHEGTCVEQSMARWIISSVPQLQSMPPDNLTSILTQDTLPAFYAEQVSNKAVMTGFDNIL
jgi:hypothetical protein